MKLSSCNGAASFYLILMESLIKQHSVRPENGTIGYSTNVRIPHQDVFVGCCMPPLLSLFMQCANTINTFAMVHLGAKKA